eukprot:jgi/Orpsp1_1/1192968/evm.model.d7180000097296.1
MNPPKTWDELIEISEYILNEERKKNNNNDIIGYYGLFPDNENTMCSLYQFLYSYREKKESPMPEFTSLTSIDALNKLLENKEKISTDEIFKSSEYLYYQSKNEGVNGSILGGFNVGINKNIDEEKIKASLEVIKYLSSERFQKEVIIKQFKFYSGLSKLYNDEESCHVIDCNIMKQIQFVFRPSTTMQNYRYFSEKTIKLFQQFLNGEKTVVEVLNNIENITKIYIFNLNFTIGVI